MKSVYLSMLLSIYIAIGVIIYITVNNSADIKEIKNNIAQQIK